MGKEISVQIKTNEKSKKIDLYCCTTKALISGRVETVGHIPREFSGHVLFFWRLFANS